jgi:hypothetical protein
MSSKRKHTLGDDFDISEDDMYRGPRLKRTRCSRNSRTTNHSNNSTQSRLRGSERASNKKDRSKTSRVAAELANLADFNAPPKPRRARSDTDEDVKGRPTRSTRHRHTTIYGQFTKPRHTQQKPKAAPTKRAPRTESLSEVAKLALWPHWKSDDEDSMEEGNEAFVQPRRHSRSYPPKLVGVQNLPWSSLPAEMRNTIYEYCMEAEEKRVLNVVHYPDGIPRRSIRGISTTTNFAHSFWGFTQTCKQVRQELTPWLLSKRSVRTRLATLNSYVELFHRSSAVDGKRIGRIEPICTAAPLPRDGVEILGLVKHNRGNPEFNLQLNPPALFPIFEELQDGDPDHYDGMSIFRDINKLYVKGSGLAFDSAGIEGIHVVTLPGKAQDDEDCGEDGESSGDDDDDDAHDIIIKLDIKEGMKGPRDAQLHNINKFLFESQLAQKVGLRLEAKIAGGRAQWKVLSQPGSIFMLWKSKRRAQEGLSLLLDEDENEADGFSETATE